MGGGGDLRHFFSGNVFVSDSFFIERNRRNFGPVGLVRNM